MAIRVQIEGRVQGVGFRYWVIGEAGRLGLDGWVRNRRGGVVEAVFCGDDGAVRAMVSRCHDGPPVAHVTRVSQWPHDAPVAAGFASLPTVD
jgi:acylphosphatase